MQFYFNDLVNTVPERTIIGKKMVEMDSLSNVDLANIDLNDPEQTKHLSRETLNKLKHQQLHEQHKG